MHVELTDDANHQHSWTRRRLVAVRSSDRVVHAAAAGPGAESSGHEKRAGGEPTDRTAETRFRRITEVVVRAGLAGGDSAAITAFRTHVDASELDEVLVWMVEAGVEALADHNWLSAAMSFTRCVHCGDLVEGFGQADTGLGLAGQAVGAAFAGDHAQVVVAIVRLLEVTDTESRNEGLVWLLRVAVKCFGEAPQATGPVSTLPQQGDLR